MGDNKTLNGALDDLRRGRSDAASVTAARLTRDQADALLDEVDRLRAALEHIASHGREMRQAIVTVLPRLDFHRGQTLNKEDEIQIEWIAEVLHKAAWLCDICNSPDTKNYADKSGLFFDSLCDEHADLADGPLWEDARWKNATPTLRAFRRWLANSPCPGWLWRVTPRRLRDWIIAGASL